MPTSPHRVTITSLARYQERIRTRRFAALVRRTLTAERAPASTVTLAITDDATIRRLNRRFRGEDAPTDVLSFSLAGRDGFVGDDQLGEVVISFPTAARQAKAAGHRLDEELAHLVVHGVLHLLGYDHEKRRAAALMRSREDALLGRSAH